jgi:hypothetical protein
MTNKTILVTLALLLSCFLISACKKDNNSDEEAFCTLVNSQDFTETGPLIDNFLAKQKKNQPEGNLEKLRAWLEAKSCIDSATILCNSCVESLPPQSVLNIDFNSNGQTINMNLVILMDERLKFRAFN